MKQAGHHPFKRLTSSKIRSIQRPGRYADGNGLYLLVDRNGSKRWVLRTIVRGRRCDLGLGSLRTVTLPDARDRAQRLRSIARDGGDPLAERRAKEAVPTFEQAARTVHGLNKASWKNGKHVAQWITSLEQYAFPVIGSMKVDQIETADILRILTPIWVAKPETAARTCQRLKVVLDWARTAGFRTDENPVLGVTKGLPKRNRTKRHQPALPFAQVPGFLTQLRNTENGVAVRLALEFLILTATRTNETLQFVWEEISDDVWTVPAPRTKSNREFRIPLGPRALSILQEARGLSKGCAYVFPGKHPGRPLSNMSLLMAIRRMGFGITSHGFRSSFSDWAHETTNFQNVVIEKALNHSIKDKAEKAYRRGDLFDKRRELMVAWDAFVAASG